MLQARSVFQIRRHREEECNRLDQQLQLYLAGSPPFDQPVLQHSSVKAWWLNLGTSNPSVVEIVNLAVFLLEIVPHAASVERVSSIMGWYHTPVRSQLDVDTLARVVALKAHLQLDVPRCTDIVNCYVYDHPSHMLTLVHTFCTLAAEDCVCFVISKGTSLSSHICWSCSLKLGMV